MNDGAQIIRGKVFVLGDNIDTDLIIPAKYLNLVPTIPEEYRKLGSYAFAGLPDGHPRFVPEGLDQSEYSIIIGGKNFGCGSSREHAPIALGAAGVKAVVAQGYARIFFRNAVATGELFPLECEERLCDAFKTGDEIEVNLDAAALLHPASGRTFRLKPLGAVAPVIRAGGLFGYARASGMIQQAPPPEPPRDATAAAPTATTSGNKKTRVIAVANQKGGVGKTTTVINLSACLAQLGQKCLIVDIDPQANATSGLGLAAEQGTSLYDALLGAGAGAELIRNTAWANLDAIPSELDLAGSEVELARSDRYLHRLETVLGPIAQRGEYDFIFIDCPPSLGILTMNGLTAADALIIPIQCEYYALEGLSVIARLMQQLRDSGANARMEIEGVVMTMHDGRTKLSDQVVKEVRRHFGDKVFRTLIPRNVRLSEAPSHGLPIAYYDAHSSGAQAYMRLAKEMLARIRKQGN